MTLSPAELDTLEAELHQAAICRTGLHNFGDPSYKQGLRALLRAFHTDIALTDAGRIGALNFILSSLVARLYTEDGWARTPKALETPITRPLIIIGLPRSGTTALHRLLSVDSQFQGLPLWLSQAPMIRPPRKDWDSYAAYRQCAADIKKFAEHAPTHERIHKHTADDVEECLWGLMQSFRSHALPEILGLHSYVEWLTPSSIQSSYLRYADVLRLIGAGESHKRWVLKCPYHMSAIDSLLKAFPDAYVVHTHRDPLEAIPSFCSLLYSGRRHTEELHPDTLGPRQCWYWKEALDKTHLVRQKVTNCFLDVDYRQFVHNPMQVVRSIYAHFDLKLSHDTEIKLSAALTPNPNSRRPHHQYAIDSWGVTASEINRIFLDYCKRHRFHY